MDECYRTKNQKHEIHYNRVKIMNFMFLDSVSVAKLKISSTQLNNFEKNIHLYIYVPFWNAIVWMHSPNAKQI